MADEPTTPPQAPTPPPPQAKGGTGLEPNVAGFLCYLAGWITGLIFFLIEKENNFVRFHAMQSILFSAGLFVLYIVLMVVQTVMSFIPYIGWIISLILTLGWAVIGIGAFVFWIILMIKAYQGERYKLPILGDMAEKYI